MKMKSHKKYSLILVSIGALNWGIVGLGMLIKDTMDWNLVSWIFGGAPTIEAIIYLLVGLSALAMFCKCNSCKEGKCKGGGKCCSDGSCGRRKEEMGEEDKDAPMQM
jgi:uncharacterized membrane protein YuzA (DUF378 family)